MKTVNDLMEAVVAEREKGNIVRRVTVTPAFHQRLNPVVRQQAHNIEVVEGQREDFKLHAE